MAWEETCLHMYIANLTCFGEKNEKNEKMDCIVYWCGCYRGNNSV